MPQLHALSLPRLWMPVEPQQLQAHLLRLQSLHQGTRLHGHREQNLQQGLGVGQGEGLGEGGGEGGGVAGGEGLHGGPGKPPPPPGLLRISIPALMHRVRKPQATGMLLRQLLWSAQRKRVGVCRAPLLLQVPLSQRRQHRNRSSSSRHRQL